MFFEIQAVNFQTWTTTALPVRGETGTQDEDIWRRMVEGQGEVISATVKADMTGDQSQYVRVDPLGKVNQGQDIGLAQGREGKITEAEADLGHDQESGPQKPGRDLNPGHQMIGGHWGGIDLGHGQSPLKDRRNPTIKLDQDQSEDHQCICAAPGHPLETSLQNINISRDLPQKKDHLPSIITERDTGQNHQESSTVLKAGQGQEPETGTF